MRLRHQIIVTLAPALLAGNARADELQNRILAEAGAMQTANYSFRRTVTLDRTGDARKNFVEQYDPRRPAAQQWSLVSVNGRAPNSKDLNDWRKSQRIPVPAYSDLAKWFGAPATRVDSGPGYATYKFQQLPKGTLKIGSHDASPDTRAEALVNLKGSQPFVERVRWFSDTSFRVMLVASVQKVETISSFNLLPDGHVVTAEKINNYTGSMLGKSGEVRSSATFSDFQPVR